MQYEKYGRNYDSYDSYDDNDYGDSYGEEYDDSYDEYEDEYGEDYDDFDEDYRDFIKKPKENNDYDEDVDLENYEERSHSDDFLNSEDEEDGELFSEAVDEDSDEYVDEASLRETEEKMKEWKIPELEGSNEEILLRIRNDKTLSDYQRAQMYSDLAQKNMNTVYYVANNIASYGIPKEELYSAGMLGFAKALDKFDPERGVKLSTFAINCIRNEIRFCLRKERRHLDNNISINTASHEDKNGNSMTIEDTLADKKATPSEEAANNELRIIIADAMNTLTPLEKYVLMYRYGFDRGIKRTQKDIAHYACMSQANISKIEKNCLERMESILKRRL